MAFGIVYVWKLFCERLYRCGAIEFIRESSLNFGGDFRLLVGHAAHDQPAMCILVISSVRIVFLTDLLFEWVQKLLEGEP